MLVNKWLLNSVAVFSPPKEGEPGPGAADPGPGSPGQQDAGDDPGEAGDAGGAEGAGDGDETPEGGAEGESKPAAAAVPDKDAWKDKEIARKHRQVQDEKRENARLKRELEDAQALLTRQPKKEGDLGTPGQQPERTFTQDDVKREAANQVAIGDYNRQCDDTFNKGKAAYKDDWDKALSQLNVLGGLGDDQQGVEVMQGILATDDPAKVLYVLGSQPDEYHRVMGLPPAKRLAEIVKLGIPDKKPVKKPSALDPPPTGITRRAEANNDAAKLYDDKTSDEDWYQARTAQKARNFAKTGNPFRSA